jgi:hypothetical protein
LCMGNLLQTDLAERCNNARWPLQYEIGIEMGVEIESHGFTWPLCISQSNLQKLTRDTVQYVLAFYFPSPHPPRNSLCNQPHPQQLPRSDVVKEGDSG